MKYNQIQNWCPIIVINNNSLEIALYELISEHVRNLISCINQLITNAFDNYAQVDVFYTDFFKTFDKFTHYFNDNWLNQDSIQIFSLICIQLVDCKDYRSKTCIISHKYTTSIQSSTVILLLVVTLGVNIYYMQMTIFLVVCELNVGTCNRLYLKMNK